MRAIAANLGIKAMSLYNHVKNKEEIVDGIVDRVVTHIYIPNPHENWKDSLKKRALSTFQILMECPWVMIPLVSKMNLWEAYLSRFDLTLACLKNAGFSLPEADYVIHTIDSYTFGFALLVIHFPVPDDALVETATSFENFSDWTKYLTLHELTKLVLHNDYNGIPNLEQGIDIFLQGLEERWLGNTK